MYTSIYKAGKQFMYDMVYVAIHHKEPTLWNRMTSKYVISNTCISVYSLIQSKSRLQALYSAICYPPRTNSGRQNVVQPIGMFHRQHRSVLFHWFVGLCLDNLATVTAIWYKGPLHLWHFVRNMNLIETTFYSDSALGHRIATNFTHPHGLQRPIR